MKKKNCLMIETTDKRKFLTHEKNYPQLIEFANTFKAEISVVKVYEGEILELAPLANAISNETYNKEPIVEIIEKKVLKTPETPETPEIPENLNIKEYVTNLFISGKEVSLHDILVKFKENTTYNNLSNLLCRIKKELSEKGHEIKKIKAGCYMLEQK